MYSERANPGDVLLIFVNQLNYFYQCRWGNLHSFTIGSIILTYMNFSKHAEVFAISKIEAVKDFEKANSVQQDYKSLLFLGDIISSHCHQHVRQLA